MKHLLEQKFFPFVNRPGRYIGGELGCIIKSPENRTSIALGYPDMYEVGMSYLGIQILYNIVNRDDRFLCERFFAPDKDAEEILRRERLPLFTLESARPLKEFDLIGFTLAYEMTATNMLNIIELSGIPLRSLDRSDEHPMVIGGGPIAHNPEPYAPFIDLFYLGDAEENILKILAIVQDTKGRPRRERLEKLTREIDGIYVPQFYDAESGAPLVDFAPEKIKSCHIDNLKREFYGKKPLIPFIETVHDRLTVEIMRGCPRGCRFCQACAVYMPVRRREKDEIILQIHEQLKQTGYDEVSLLSLSSSDYHDIIPLTMQLAYELDKKKVALSLPSLRPGTFTQELADAVKMTRKTGLTFAPEAGTERLRAIIRKDITDQELYDTVELVYKNDWNLIKLYFMIGLPNETDEDINGIVRMVRKLVELGRPHKNKKIINITISPFSPKAHTPFQWDQQPSPEYIREKGEYLKRALHGRTVNIKLRDPNLSLIEGVIGRGDRKIGEVIETAYKKGARFDGWGELYDFEVWRQSFEECGIDYNTYLRGRAFSENLPWSKVQLHRTTEMLMNERNRTSTILREHQQKPAEPAPAKKETDDDDFGFGRTPRKGVARTGVAPTTGNIRFRWGRQGLTRFLSHRDNMRLFERAIRRAQIPAAFSQGYHPHMKLSFGPPLALGYTSEAEYFDLTLDAPFTPYMITALGETLPEGYSIFNAKPIINTRISISGKVNLAVYEALMDKNADYRAKIDELLSRDAIELVREAKEEKKIVDIKPAIRKMEYNPDDGKITMELALGTAGYARPTEAIAAAGLVAPEIVPTIPIHRREMYYVAEDGSRLTPMEF